MVCNTVVISREASNYPPWIMLEGNPVCSILSSVKPLQDARDIKQDHKIVDLNFKLFKICITIKAFEDLTAR